MDNEVLPTGLGKRGVYHTDHSPYYYYLNKTKGEREETKKTRKHPSRCSGVVVAEAQVWLTLGTHRSIYLRESSASNFNGSYVTIREALAD